MCGSCLLTFPSVRLFETRMTSYILCVLEPILFKLCTLFIYISNVHTFCCGQIWQIYHVEHKLYNHWFNRICYHWYILCVICDFQLIFFSLHFVYAYDKKVCWQAGSKMFLSCLFWYWYNGFPIKMGLSMKKKRYFGVGTRTY